MKKTGVMYEKNRTDIDEKMNGLYEELAAYGRSDYYPYHMPGHKRNREAGAMAQYYGIDITEIDGFDDLHHAEGILWEAQQRANKLYGNEDSETFYLVNGSTCGVLAAVMAAAKRGEEILIARNCHKSVYHAGILQELNLRYYYPSVLEEYGICDGVGAEDIGCLLEEYPACKAVVITSPTYEGILSDVHAVADVVHAHDKILIVDEAHGAHLCLHKTGSYGAQAGADEVLLPDALSAGADLVIHSLHKTLPAMTQTALLHVQGQRVDRGRLRRYLSMLQTSSPSYVLMASMDSCIRYVETHGAQRYAYMRRQYDIFCKKIEKCRHIRIGSMDWPDMPCGSGKNYFTKKKRHMAGWDIGKLVIYARDGILNGQQLYDLLRDDYHLQMEMAAESFVLAIMTIMDTQEGWQRLADALQQIDDRIEEGPVTAISGGEKRATSTECGQNKEAQEQDRPRTGKERTGKQQYADNGMTAAQAFLGKWEEAPLAKSVGKAAGDFINLYPPGIPLLVPGEIVGEELPALIEKNMQMGLRVQGVTPEGKAAVIS